MSLATIPIEVPDGQSGDWRVESFTITKEESDRSRMRAWRPMEYVEPGDYKKLMRGSMVVMSNTRMEIQTNRWIINRAKGHVLINGLGLGMVLTAILEKDEVESVTVVEVAREVIDLVGPHFESDDRVKIIHADAFDYKPERGARFDVVWHDIWDFICADNLAEMTKLKRKYGCRCDAQACWAETECRIART